MEASPSNFCVAQATQAIHHIPLHHVQTRHTADALSKHASGLAGAKRSTTSSKSTCTHTATSSITEHTQPGQQTIPASTEARHPGTADAAHRLARAGLQERNGPKPTRGARATRPATSQHRVGRRRRGSDESVCYFPDVRGPVPSLHTNRPSAFLGPEYV